MHPDVAALLAVQDDDLSIDALETQLAALRPRIDQMSKDREKAAASLQQAKQAADAEERRRAEVAGASRSTRRCTTRIRRRSTTSRR